MNTISPKKTSPVAAPVLPSAAPVASAPVAPADPKSPAAPAQVRQDGSSFSAAASTRPAVALSAAAASRGPLALDSQAARGAIQKSLDFLQSSTPSARGVVAGPAVSSQLKPSAVFSDELGQTHVRLDRTHEGVKVFGEQLISHLDPSGKVDSVTGSLSSIPQGLGSDAVKLSSQDALALAQKQFAGSTDRAPSSERVIVKDKSGAYHSAYQVQLTHTSDLKAGERPRRMNYFVDANSGEMLKSFDQMGGIELPNAKKPGTSTPAPTTPTTPTSPGKANDTTMYSGKVDIQTTKQKDGSYTLEDKTRGGGVVTYDAKNKQQASGSTQFTDKNDVWGEATDGSRTKAAVDAHYGAEMTYDFYKDVLGRDSIDGKGEQLKSYVHLDNNYNNAYWDGSQMNYGDGDGKDFSPLTTLDIAGHEITHGLTERTAGLVYEGESGGLNESFSDIMGTGVEWYAAQKNTAVKANWEIGEKAYTPGNGDSDALRYMNDPTKDGYSIDNYKDFARQSEVHGSSGIANNAFYLLTQGGKNRTSGLEVKDGIGMDKSLKIFGRALTTYMTPETTFAQAREATLKAATDLYGASSPEAQKVKDAWTAVGVR